jgi:DUF1009 family protein
LIARGAPDKGGRIGLIAGSGKLPHLFAQAASSRGLSVIAVAHQGETDPSLSAQVDALWWVRLGQIDRIVRIFREGKVNVAVMAGGVSRLRAFTGFHPDLGALRVLLRLRTFGDDALLRAIAGYLEEAGIQILAPTDFLSEIFAPSGHLAGPELDPGQRRDVEVGIRVAELLGRADVGQTVVVKKGQVLALEAIEGTDETVRRGARLGGAGAIVVKLSKPGQDQRFDLPTVGANTIAVMRECGANVLAVEAGKTILLDAPALLGQADRERIALLGVVLSAAGPGHRRR